MAVQFYPFSGSSKIVFRGGKVAMGEDCCCWYCRAGDTESSGFMYLPIQRFSLVTCDIGDLSVGDFEWGFADPGFPCDGDDHGSGRYCDGCEEISGEHTIPIYFGGSPADDCVRQTCWFFCCTVDEDPGDASCLTMGLQYQASTMAAQMIVRMKLAWTYGALQGANANYTYVSDDLDLVNGIYQTVGDFTLSKTDQTNYSYGQVDFDTAAEMCFVNDEVDLSVS